MSVSEQFNRRLNVESTIHTLKADGCCFVDRLLGRTTVEELEREFDRVMNTNSKAVSTIEYPPGRMRSIDVLGCDRAMFPKVFSIFLSETFQRIADEYLPAGWVSTNEIVFAHEYKPMSISEVHFDSRRSLKFMIYLRDTDVENGAFEYMKGSHLDNAAYREEYLGRGGQILDLQNLFSSAEPNNVELRPNAGGAGSLIVFDTDGWHSAGSLSDTKKERKVIRTRYLFGGQPRIRTGRFSRYWLGRKLGVFRKPPPFDIPGRERVGVASMKGSLTRKKPPRT